MLYSEMFPLRKDTTEYKKISGDFVSSSSINGRDTLVVSSDALTLLAENAFRDVSHLLRSSHLAQLRSILDDKSASKNDHFVAMELLKNANKGGECLICAPYFIFKFFPLIAGGGYL